MARCRLRMIGFHVTDEMADAIAAAAAKAGINQSTWLRRLIAREVGVKADVPTGQAALNEKQKAARAETYRKTIAAKKETAKKS